MKKFFCGACLLIVVTTVYAKKDLVYISEDKDGRRLYIDESMLKYDKKKNTVTSFEKIDNVNIYDEDLGKTIASAYSEIRYFCNSKQKVTLAAFVRFSDNSLSRMDVTLDKEIDIKKSDIKLGTISETYFNAVCTNPPKITLPYSDTNKSSDPKPQSAPIPSGSAKASRSDSVVVATGADGQKFYIDKSTLIYNPYDNSVIVLVKDNLTYQYAPANKLVISTESQEMFFCGTKQKLQLKLTGYDSTGNPVYSTRSTGKQQAIKPNTVDEVLFNAVCQGRKAFGRG